MGQKKGAIVEVPAPKGTITYEIVKIRPVAPSAAPVKRTRGLMPTHREGIITTSGESV